MSGESLDYGVHALEFVERLDSLESRDDVVDVLTDSLALFGFRHFVVTGLPGPYEKFGANILLRQLPTGWFDHYMSRDYADADPVIRRCRQSVQPFEWDEAPYSVEREPKAHEVMVRARDFGLKRGFSVPIHGVGLDACFSMSGSEIDLTGRSKPAVHLMAMYAFERARQLAERGGRARLNPLSPREQEVLCWAAAGKSAVDTGEIMGIAERTVTAHMSHAMEKLGAANKTHAVARAVKERFISL